MKNYLCILIILFPVLVIGQTNCTNDSFAGKDRKEAKTSIVTAPVEVFNTLPALIKTLPTDDYMRGYEPPITKDSDSQRVEEENRSVSVKTAYIFVIYREGDNDYHTIIGSNSDTSKALLMNVEVSGLPDKTSSNYTVMKELRDKMVVRFGKICGSKKFFIDKPIKISVSGSLFYDIDHKPGVVGYKNLKPKTAWEIHPVTDIVFK
ncbi:MAG: hypothetical protein ABSD71_08635 [Bacteroidales bacterium]|jgi:hypothetical protein